MRLFTAVGLPKALRDDLAAGAAPRIASVAGARAIPADRMHVTIRFLGNFDLRLVARLRDDLRAAVAAVFGGMGVVYASWGDRMSRRTRVFWAGVVDADRILHRLETEVTRVVTPLGVPTESRSYRPHITLSRVRRKPGKPVPPFEGETSTVGWNVGRTEFPVREIVLFESELGRDGPRYRALDRFPLAAG